MWLSGAVALIVPVAFLVAPVPAQAEGDLYLTETFTGSSTVPGFVGYGSACLTGAVAGTPGPGGHPLGGCPVAGEGPVPPTGGAPYGYLQLTDSSLDQAGAVLYDIPIPSTQGLSVTFEQWQYGWVHGAAPADGINFFLVDGAATLSAPGAFGGSLGYAQKLPDDDPVNPFVPGVDHGYLGVGLDVLGNYFGDWEKRGNGCPVGSRSPAGTGFRIPEPNKITVRGPGNGTTGYCFLTSTSTNLDNTTGPWDSTLLVTLQGSVTSVPGDPLAAQTTLAPDKRTVTITITPAPDPIVTVSIAAATGPAFQVLQFPAPSPIPASYKFGFSASTGAFSDVHLVRNVQIESVEPTPLLTLDKTPDSAGPFKKGDKVTYTYAVANTGQVAVTGLKVLDDRIPAIVCERTELAPVTQAPLNSTVCRGTYTITKADVDRGKVVNTAIASDGEGGVVSPPDTATVFTSPSVTITKAKLKPSADGCRIVLRAEGRDAFAGRTIRLYQKSGKRWARLNTRPGKVKVSARKAWKAKATARKAPATIRAWDGHQFSKKVKLSLEPRSISTRGC